jgi:Cu/Ag efflux pump CusA
VVLIIGLFLLSGRATLITALAIPLSLSPRCWCCTRWAPLNTMTLGGMAIAVGALVDDAIIDVENVVRRLRENVARAPEPARPALEVVFDASARSAGPSCSRPDHRAGLLAAVLPVRASRAACWRRCPSPTSSPWRPRWWSR